MVAISKAVAHVSVQCCGSAGSTTIVAPCSSTCALGVVDVDTVVSGEALGGFVTLPAWVV
jgi:hypothetical protein